MGLLFLNIVNKIYNKNYIFYIGNGAYYLLISFNKYKMS